MGWERWTELNRQLLEEWRRLLKDSPTHRMAAAAPLDHAFVDLCDDVVAVFEAGIGCVQLSANWERITNRPVPESVMDGFYASVHPGQVKAFIAAVQMALCDDPRVRATPQEFALRGANGKPFWVRLKFGARTRGEHADRITLLLENIHELRAARDEASAATARRNEALQVREDFFSAVNHDLRTPLNAILGFTQIMESGMYGDVSNPHYREYLRHMRESGYELLAQIEELMNAGDAPGTPPPLLREACDAAELLAQTIGLHQARATSAQMRLVLEAWPGYATLLVDRPMVLHALSHLVSHALRHGRAGGCITLAARRTSEGELLLSVADDGVGMSTRRLHSVVSALRAEPGEDTALDMELMLAKQFAAAHGGYLTVESSAGAGTTVTLCLPHACVAEATHDLDVVA